MSSRCSKRIERLAGMNLADHSERVKSTASPVQVGAETIMPYRPTVVKSSDRAMLTISLPTETTLHDLPENTKSPGQRVFLTRIIGRASPVVGGEHGGTRRGTRGRYPPLQEGGARGGIPWSGGVQGGTGGQGQGVLGVGVTGG
ncbi:hypothetical protein SEA_DINGER_69 [Rhodococcus phage Dinger]|uniref:Uncharacterized protein n=1 Tax=Rhodococcus phage Dinger TaxID=2708634 RepID=A0A6G6XSC8_9CAUD|nr:hypothetical protein SEA_DINGER_69 [Rhodococcus phage Dinger]